MRNKTAYLILAFYFISHFSFSKEVSSIFFKKADKFFRQYVQNGKVNYVALQHGSEELNDLVNMIGSFDLNNANEKTKKAFYINAYHLLIIHSVTEKLPVNFPLEEPGFFSSEKHMVAKELLTLNEIEERKIMNFKDVRVFFVLSSPTQGSIPVANFAYKPNKLNKQFKKRIKETVNNFSFIRVMNKSSLVLFEESFRKADRDFLNDLISLVNKYREDPLPAAYKIDFYPSGRKLNIISQLN
ncbi:MAG: DUF547 domain-containing protein [Cytophagaceae bacterium]|nr:DUF547 domain-containing protein [Cytophagaceae bacterium]